MRRKFIHIFTITLLATCFVGQSAFAQEGEEEPEKQETTVLEKDSIPEGGMVQEEPKGDLSTPIVITPKEPRTLFPEGDMVPVRQQGQQKKQNTTETEKDKEENTSNLRFNFIYYLFYKFKVGS